MIASQVDVEYPYIYEYEKGVEMHRVFSEQKPTSRTPKHKSRNSTSVQAHAEEIVMVRGTITSLFIKYLHDTYMPIQPGLLNQTDSIA